jgi:hypothetical protein
MTTWFFVLSFDFQEGKETELIKWMKTTGRKHWEGTEGIKSVKMYMRAMGLGRRPVFQVWLEIPDLAFLDKWKDIGRQLVKGDELFQMAKDYNSSLIKEI